MYIVGDWQQTVFPPPQLFVQFLPSLLLLGEMGGGSANVNDELLVLLMHTNLAARVEALFAILYVNDGYIASTDAEFLQEALDILGTTAYEVVQTP
jgi:hypothetical protein